MSSLSHQLRESLMMTHEEQEELIASGWPAVIIVELRRRGFREVCPMVNGDGSTTPAFLRQTELPHIHLALEKSTTLEALDTAIFDAGQESRHQYLADQWHRFTGTMKAWHRPQKPTDFEARLTKLEATLKANDKDQAQPPDQNQPSST